MPDRYYGIAQHLAGQQLANRDQGDQDLHDARLLLFDDRGSDLHTVGQGAYHEQRCERKRCDSGRQGVLLIAFQQVGVEIHLGVDLGWGSSGPASQFGYRLVEQYLGELALELGLGLGLVGERPTASQSLHQHVGIIVA